MRRNTAIKRLNDGIDIPYVIGQAKKSAALPVKVTVDVTPKVSGTLIGFGLCFAAAAIGHAYIKYKYFK